MTSSTNLTPKQVRKGARKLRLAVVTNLFKQKLISEKEAKEILRGRLDPKKEDSVVDDSELLGDPYGLILIEADDTGE